MKILEITAANFGNIHISTPVRFDNGLNVWVSRNQAGKTTLLTFLEWMLYGPASRRGVKAPENVQRWVPWQGAVPGGTIVVSPELKNWPKQLIIRAEFSKFEILVEDSATGRNFTEHITVDKGGEWNLGQLLLNLSRESFRYSLAVMQDNLLDPLRQGHLRQILTSDLGSLVENPNLSVIDRVIDQLNGPQFSLSGSMSLPLADHRRALEKEQDFLRLEQERLEQHLGEFRELLLTRDSLTAQFEEQQRVIYGLDRQAEQLELARNYFLLKGQGKQMANADVAQRSSAPPPAATDTITPELEREVSKLAAQLEVVENQLAHERRSLQTLQQSMSGAQSHNGKAQPTAIIPPSLASSIDNIMQDLGQAGERITTLAESIPDAQRKRFDELRKLYEPHHEQLSTLMNWQREHMQTNEDLAKLRERRVELEYLSRIKLPKRFYVGLGLILPAVFLTFASVYFPTGVDIVGWIVAVVCWIIAAIFCSSFWRARQKAGPHVNELRTKVLPAMETCREQMQALDRRRRRFIDMYKVGRLDYDKLVENIMEYTQLDMQLREYNSAIRDRDTLQRKLHSTWARLCEAVPLAPPSLDLKWLQKHQTTATIATSAEDVAVELKARMAERQEDVERLEAARQRMLDRIAGRLESAGLKIDDQASLQTLLDQLRQMASAAEQERHASELSQALAGSATDVLSEEEFNYRWEHLPKAARTQLMQLAETLDGYQSATARLHEISKTRKHAEQEREQLRQQMDELRDQLARFGLLDAEATQLDQRIRDAKARYELVLRWEQGVALTRQLIDSLVTRASQDVAPEINKELSRVLETAPIAGLRSASLSPTLELRLELAGMPAETPMEERWQYLSAGAQAQLALVLRLALAQTASGRTGLPLLLDEPFSELDDERASLLFAYITKLAKSCQIILTTCHGLLAKWLLEQHKQAYTLEVNK